MPKQKKVAQPERKPLYTQNAVLKFARDLKEVCGCTEKLADSVEQNISALAVKLSEADREILLTILHILIVR